MNNLSAAKSAIRAELAHVQSGLSYYQERVEALNEALNQLDAIEDAPEIDLEQPAKKKRGRPKLVEKKAAARAEKKAKPRGRSAAKANRLPFTGGDFFPNLLTERGQTAPEILQAAADQIPFKLKHEERVQLRGRMIATLAAMLKSGKIGSEGEGRQRTFFKA